MRCVVRPPGSDPDELQDHLGPQAAFSRISASPAVPRRRRLSAKWQGVPKKVRLRLDGAARKACTVRYLFGTNRIQLHVRQHRYHECVDLVICRAG
jgi:hypothetical protein